MRHAALTLGAIFALSSPVISHAAPPGTDVLYVVAVDSHGHPGAGFKARPADDEDPTVSDCEASPAAVSANIYQCSPGAVGADACWAAKDNSLLCLDDPWDRQLNRVLIADELRAVSPVADPLPLALQLDDGTRCRLRTSGAWGGRDDGYEAAYGCEASDVTVLSGPGGDVVDRSAPAWTVRVGPIGVGDMHFAPPETRTVRTAWFAGRPG